MGERVLHKFVHPQAGKRQRYALVPELVGQAACQLGYAGVVAGGQRGKRDFLIARVLDGFFGQLYELVHAALAHRTVEHARLAEAAPARAAAHDLQHDAVKHGLDIGHGRSGGRVGVFKIGQDAAKHPRRCAGVRRLKTFEGAVGVILVVIEAGHIHAAQRSQPFQPLRAGNAFLFAGVQHVGDLDDGVLAVADQKRVDEQMKGLRVKRAGAARQHDGVILPALGREHRHAAQVHHLQHVGIAHLVLEGKADDVKAGKRRMAFQRAQRNFAFSKFTKHVHPRHAYPLAHGIGQFVENAVEDFHAQVAHGHLVGIGKAEGKGDFRLGNGLYLGVHLAAGVARGLLHAIQQRVKIVGHKSSLTIGAYMVMISCRCNGCKPGWKKRSRAGACILCGKPLDLLRATLDRCMIFQ